METYSSTPVKTFSDGTHIPMPKIAVLMPAYGQSAYITEAIESLQRQTLTDWELAIVDDGSPDDVADVVAPFLSDERIRFYHTPNRGVSAARNYAASMTTAPYIVALDADDVIAPDYLKRCFVELESNPELKVAYSDWKFFGAAHATPKLCYNGYRDLLLSNSIFCSAMVRRLDFERFGGFDERMLIGYEDWEFWIRLLAPGDCPESPEINAEVSPTDIQVEATDIRVRQITAPLFKYRIKKQSRSKSADQDGRMTQCYSYIYDKHRNIYDRAFPDMLSLLVELKNLRRREEKWRKRSIFSRLWYAIRGKL